MKKGNIFNAERDNHGNRLKIRHVVKKLSSHPLYIIVAVDEKYGIGKGGKLPWHLKGDMEFFREMTTKTDDPKKQNMVIMGRKTWESIPEKFRPLEGRKNGVLTRDNRNKIMLTETTNARAIFPRELDTKQGTAKAVVEIFHSLNEAIASARNDKEVEKIFIIGGAQVFKEALSHPDLSGIYLTKIHKTFECDTFFKNDFDKKESENIFEKKFRCEKIAQKKENNLEYDFLFFQ